MKDFAVSKAVFTGLAAALVLTLGASETIAGDPGMATAPAAQAPAQTGPTQSAATPAPAVQPPKKRFGDEVVCKQEEEPGSRLGGKKVCMTRDDWAQQSRDAQDGMYNGRH
jgi:hypothetical protein